MLILGMGKLEKTKQKKKKYWETKQNKINNIQIIISNLILNLENMGKTSLLQAIQKQKKSFLRSPKSPKSHAPISTDGINILSPLVFSLFYFVLFSSPFSLSLFFFLMSWSISTVTFDEYLKEPPADGSPVITEKKLFRKRMVERLILGIWDFAGQGLTFLSPPLPPPLPFPSLPSSLPYLIPFQIHITLLTSSSWLTMRSTLSFGTWECH